METGNLRGQLPQPYATNNAPLAMVLHMCGVPWLIAEGVIFPGFNLYGDGMLEARGYKGKPRTASIKDLWTKGIPGQIVYQFEVVPGSPLIEEITGAWCKMEKAIKEATAASYERPGAPYASTPTTSGPVATADVIAMVCCQFMKTRKEFYGDRADRVEALWRRRGPNNGKPFFPACKAVEGASRTETEGEKRFFYGSMELHSVKV